MWKKKHLAPPPLNKPYYRLRLYCYRFLNTTIFI